MSVTKGTPASSQIIFLEQRVAEQEAEIDRLRGLIQFIGQCGEDMAGELWEVGCSDYRIEDGKAVYTGQWKFIRSRGDTFIEAVENEMRSQGKLP